MGTREIRKRKAQLHMRWIWAKDLHVHPHCQPTLDSPRQRPVLPQLRRTPLASSPASSLSLCSPPGLSLWHPPPAVTHAAHERQHFSRFSHCSGILDHQHEPLRTHSLEQMLRQRIYKTLTFCSDVLSLLSLLPQRNYHSRKSTSFA